jgi:hypothetical protein
MKNLYIYLTNQFHSGSLIVLIALDLFWSVFEGGLAVTGIGFLIIPLLMVVIFPLCFTAVTLIQKYAFNDHWPAALAKGLGFGIVAALPFSFVGILVAAGWGLMRLLYGVDQEVILLGKLTHAWRDVELTLRRLAPPDIRNETTEDVINYLYNHRVLSANVKDRLHYLRKLRNVNTHEISTNELSALVDAVLSTRDNLQRRILR